MCKEVEISTSENNNRATAVVFVDTGSQRSFISSHLAKELGVFDGAENERVRISTFANDQTVLHRRGNLCQFN